MGRPKHIIKDVRQEFEDKGYELVSDEYLGANAKLKAKCSEHGIVEIKYGDLRRGRRCPFCSCESKKEKRKIPIQNLREEIERRGYHMTSTDYANAHTKIRIECKEHGVFEIKYNNFQQGQGCSTCAGNRRLTTEHVRKIVEGMGYGLLSDSYVNNHTKLKINCWKHGGFYATYISLKNGSGCPSCAEYGFNPDKPAILYYLEILHRGHVYYKVGITNRTVEARYHNSDLKKITILREWDYEHGRDACDKEQRIIEEFSDCLYQGTDTILEGASGNAELFTEDVLQLQEGLGS